MKREQSIAVRFFLLTFVPVSLALATGFWLFGQHVEDDVRAGLRKALAGTEQAQAKLRLAGRQRQQQLVAALAENASLKVGLLLWRAAAEREIARRTVEDQLVELGENLQADLVGLLDDEKRAIAVLARRDGQLVPIGVESLPVFSCLARLQNQIYDLLPVPVNLDAENVGQLVVGHRFDPGMFHQQALLTEGESVVASSGLDAAGMPALGRALAACGGKDCSVTLAGTSFLALPVDASLFGGGPYAIWTLHSVDAACEPILGTARQGLWVAMLSTLIASVLAHFYGGRSVAHPLVALVDRLHESEKSGVIEGNFPEGSCTREVNELAHAFNLAARSVAESQRRLDEAYLQFTQTMAQTLDARDPYTAGHTSRVGQYATDVATAMNLPAKDIDIIRVGANLHDIGKIGIPDHILQKGGPLTAAEYEIIKRHPVIGKRILEGVAKFRDYLRVVELHHENHDGTGYPWGLHGDNIPLGARIVHVVDAYDAMTTSRPYRAALSREKALAILSENAGTQFDPAVVEVFLRTVQSDPGALPACAAEADVGGQLALLKGRLEEAKYAEDPVH